MWIGRARGISPLVCGRRGMKGYASSLGLMVALHLGQSEKNGKKSGERRMCQISRSDGLSAGALSRQWALLIFLGEAG